MPSTRLYKLIATLLLASFACNLILITRNYLFVNPYYSFLNWNLLLAWIPLACAALANHLAHNHKNTTPLILILLTTWFIFYPNAPYMITDFLHLKNSGIYAMFDIITLFSYAVTGLVIGFASLELAQATIRKYFGRLVSWIFALACLTLGSFGVYLGRFLRWNSWEVFTKPDIIIRDMLGTIVNPLLYTHLSLAFTCVFTIFCASLYLVYHTLSKKS